MVYFPSDGSGEHRKHGDVSEWSKEAVLKTVGMQVPVGSNPTISATFSAKSLENREISRLFLLFAILLLALYL